MKSNRDPVDSFVDDNEAWLADRVDRAQSGDAAALGELVAYYRNYLLRIASLEMDSRLKGKVSASDLVQESLVNVNQHIQDFRGSSPIEFKIWIRRIIQNQAKNSNRRFVQAKSRDIKREVRMNNSAVQFPPVPDRANTPCTDAMLREKAQAIELLLNTMPENYRTVIQLRNWQELSFEQVGEAMQLSSDAARKLWYRAVIKLQKTVENDFPELNSGSIEINYGE